MISTPDSILDEVLSERLQQINRHHHTHADDDGYAPGVLADAGAAYAMKAAASHMGDLSCPLLWPWHPRTWKPKRGRRHMLIKAMALLCAEVETIDRAQARR